MNYYKQNKSSKTFYEILKIKINQNKKIQLIKGLHQYQ